MNHNFLKNMALAALFLAIGLVLPFFTGQIPAVGKMLLPMHIPVLLCGLICGWQWGLGVGFVLPVLRSVLFSMPVMYPRPRLWPLSWQRMARSSVICTPGANGGASRRCISA